MWRLPVMVQDGEPDGAGPGECPNAEYISGAGRSPTYGTTWFYSE
jgi:hypothetical protein